MAISLNDHETRIKKLEQGGTLPTYSGAGWYDFPGGLQIRFGVFTTTAREVWNTVTFSKSFSNKCITLSTSCMTQNDNTVGVTSLSTTGFKVWNNIWNEGPYVNQLPLGYIAIGYLISNRILNHAYAYVKSLRDFKVMIKSHFFCLIPKFTREVI